MGNNKKKGNRNELFFAKALSKRFDDTFSRVPSSGAIGTKMADTGLNEEAKVILSGDLITPSWFLFSVEVKSRKEFNFWDLLNRETKNEIDEWIEQAEDECVVSKRKPMILVKINNRKPFAVLRLEEELNYNIVYGNYGIIRFDYLLGESDEFFGKEN